MLQTWDLRDTLLLGDDDTQQRQSENTLQFNLILHVNLGGWQDV